MRTPASAPPQAAEDRGALGTDGRPTGAVLPTQSIQGTKPAPQAAGPIRTGANTTGTGGSRPLTAPTVVDANFDGINQTEGGGAQPPDVNAAVGLSQILEPVNRRVTVYGKTGGTQCTNTLAGWLGQGTTNVFDPRALYDNLNHRFILIATTTGTAGAAPRLFLAASQTSNACGGWWVFTITFTGGPYPNGTLLDYPYLGQDQAAILSSTNNFNPGYINSTAWAAPKSAVYNGLGFSFPAFAVSASTAPATATGVPIGATTNTYFVASVAGTGYRLYRMNNSAGPGTTLVLQATITSCFAPGGGSISCSFNPPPRRVLQCGTSTTLDPLDGRIVWSPVQAVSSTFVWFAHGLNIAGYPGVRYGAINTASNTAEISLAFRSGTSDDFNPSIGAFETSPNAFYVWLNWSYTDQPNCANTTVTVDGVLPGAGVPNLIGTSLNLVSGSATSTNTRFGDYSSVHVDPVAASPTCPAGRTALIAQQYFGPTQQWHTRLARVSFC